jgi:hypothetical protein
MTGRAARAVLGCGLLAVVLALPTHAGASTVFMTSISGKQDLNWSLDGTTGSCEIRHGVGSGAVSFHFKSSKPAPALSNSTRKLAYTVSIPSVATGTLAGAFTDSSQTACPGNAPSETFVEETDGCGATHFGVRVDVVSHGAFLYVTGPNVPLGPVSISLAGGHCPFPLGASSFDTSTDRTACGDGEQLWKRSWGVSYDGGAGLLASKIHMTPKQFKRKKLTITGRKSIDCMIPSQYTGGIHMTGKLTYTLTLKRLR